MGYCIHDLNSGKCWNQAIGDSDFCEIHSPGYISPMQELQAENVNLKQTLDDIARGDVVFMIVAERDRLQSENKKLKKECIRLQLDLRRVVSCYKDHCATMNADWTEIARKMRDIADKAYWESRGKI